MKRLLIVGCILLILSAPALAQDTNIDPAAYLPARTPFYIELNGEPGFDTLETLLNLNGQSVGMPPSDPFVELTQLLNNAFPGEPGIDFQTDVLSWAGDRIGVAAATLALIDASQNPDFMLVLPIQDPAGAQAFVQRVASSAAPEDAGGVQLYRGNELTLAVGTSVMWLSTHAGIDSLFSFGAPENLTQNPAYQKIRAALPPDAPLAAYVSGRYLSSVGNGQEIQNPTAPYPSLIWQALLQLHPAESAAEDALLALPNLNGIGAAAQLTDNTLDVTALLSVDAQYPAPTLPTTTAGTALLNLIPDDSNFAFASYDFTIELVAGAAWSGVIAPASNAIINRLNATPQETLTEIPVQLNSVESIIEQVHPVIRQAESTLGISLDELSAVLNGEYALAAFPNADQTPTAALYLQSSDPQRVIAALENASRMILTNPSPPEQWFTVERANVSGVDVAFISGQGLSERMALGILEGNVLLVTPESALQHVLLAATSDMTASTPILDAHGEIGEGQEVFFYADLLRVGASSFSSLWGTFDVRENGVFAVHLTGQLASLE